MIRFTMLGSAVLVSLLLVGCDGGGSAPTVGQEAPPGSLEVPRVEGGFTLGDPVETPPGNK